MMKGRDLGLYDSTCMGWSGVEWIEAMSFVKGGVQQGVMLCYVMTWCDVMRCRREAFQRFEVVSLLSFILSFPRLRGGEERRGEA